MTKRRTTPLHGGRPSALQHAERREQKAKFDRPRHVERHTDRDGKFTVPHTKGQRK